MGGFDGLSGADRNEVFRNLGNGSFEPVLDIPPTADSIQTAGASTVDFDNDGDLDLFVPGRAAVRARRNVSQPIGSARWRNG